MDRSAVRKEKEIRGRSPEERRAVRNERSRPLLESFETMVGRDLRRSVFVVQARTNG